TCKRIEMPSTGINLITELHSYRFARVITAHGLTSQIPINSGIEQGETYSPLLWKIYYDPILYFIQEKYKNHLLKISCQSPIDIITNTTSSSITIPPLAFIDDTTWHCESANIMQNIINDTSELYRFNNIEINTTKSDLLYIKPKFLTNPTPTLSMNQQNILPRKPQDVIRYLGIFYDGKGSSKPTLDQIQNKIENFFILIRHKKITPSQISLLFNLILQPSLEYLLQIILIHTNTRFKFSRLFTIHTKKMLSLAKNTNNI